MHTDGIVSAAWLADRLGDDTISVLDVRDPWEYEGIGHLPGAVNVPFDAVRDDGDADVGTLPGADAFHSPFAERGVDPDDTIVAYDDTHGVFAARVLFTALVYGYEDVRLLEGDYSAWMRDHEVTTEVPDPAPTDRRPEPLSAAERPIADRGRVEAALDGDAVLLDTRDPEEFAAGHLRGAKQFDWTDVLDPETRGLKPAEALRAGFEELDVTPGRPVILYCNTARRLCHTFAVLRWLGYEDVAVYEGSLTDWREHGGPLVSDD
ncbi:sulfurtransferase [Haloferacaceae archaeon DSL9]